MSLQTVKLSQLEPNPYRHFETYPIVKEKIDELMASIDATGFWGETVIARKIGSTYQIAFGHHRIEAARKQLGKNAKAQISIRNLDDNQMLAMMARENSETYAITADMDMELVRAAIEGFAEGYIDLPRPKPTNRGVENGLLPADFGFDVMSDNLLHIKFTRDGLGKLLGMPHRRLVHALANLKVVNVKKLASKKDYQGLKHDQADQLTRQVVKVKNKAGEKAAREAAPRISKALKQKEFGSNAGGHPSRKTAERIADEVIEKTIGKQLPDIDAVSVKTASTIKKFLESSELAKTLAEIVKYSDSLSPFRRKSLIAALKGLEKIAVKYREILEGQPAKLRRIK